MDWTDDITIDGKSSEVDYVNGSLSVAQILAYEKVKNNDTFQIYPIPHQRTSWYLRISIDLLLNYFGHR